MAWVLYEIYGHVTPSAYIIATHPIKSSYLQRKMVSKETTIYDTSRRIYFDKEASPATFVEFHNQLSKEINH